MAGSHYRELIAWQKSVDLVVLVYRLTTCFPKNEVYGLTDQLRRAAVSVPSNIAEGQGRGISKAFIGHLRIARGSLQEVETQLIIAQRLGYIDGEQSCGAIELSAEVSRILGGLIRSLK